MSAVFSITSPLKVVAPSDVNVAVLTKFLLPVKSIEYPFIFPVFFNDSSASKLIPPLFDLISAVLMISLATRSTYPLAVIFPLLSILFCAFKIMFLPSIVALFLIEFVAFNSILSK